MKKYVLIDVFERDFGLPQVFDTAEAALGALVEAVAEVRGMEPGVILRALHETGSYCDNGKCEVYKTYAWANNGNGSLDAAIYELDTETWRCAV